MSSGVAPPRAERHAPQDAVVRVNRLLRTFSVQTSAEVGSRLRELCVDQVLYADPLARAEGVAAMATHVDFLRRVQSGRRMVLSSGVDVVHEYARFAWRLTDPRGRVQFDGFCVTRFAPSALFAEVIAFIGPFPPLQMRVTVPT
ncbi:hypothetical protein OG216_03525 [Streptomycetaceae bacterium NBC_01309]